MTTTFTNIGFALRRHPEPRGPLCGPGLVVVVAVLACRCASPQVDTLEIEPGRVRCFTATDRVFDVRPAPGGDDLLVATEGGLLHYGPDGELRRKWTRRDGLPGHTLRAIETTDDGTVWIAAAQGLIRLSDGRVRSYTTDDGLNDNRVYTLALDGRGRLFAGTHRGVSLLDGDRFVPFNDTHEFSRRPTYDIHADASGSVWFAKQNSLTQHQEDGRWRTFQRDPARSGPKSDIVSNSVRHVVTDRHGRPWIGTPRGLGYFDEAEWKHLFHNSRHGSSRGLQDNRVAALALDREGSLWVGHGDSVESGRTLGLARSEGSGWHYFDEQDGLPSNRVYRVRVDEQGTAWIATARGAARYAAGRFETYHDAGELPANRILQLAGFGDDRVAVLTGAGIAQFDRGERRVLEPPPHGDVQSIAVAAGVLYAGTRNHGLWIHSDDGWIPDPTLGSSAIRSLASASATSVAVWVLHDRGLSYGAPGAWKTEGGFREAGAERLSRLFVGPGNRVWISGVGEQRELIGIGAAGSLLSRSILHQPLLAHVGFDGAGSAWLASGDGLVNLTDDRRLEPPLRDFVPRVTARDTAGRLWVGTAKNGLLRFDGGSWVQILLHGRPLPFEITDLLFENDDTLWIGTAGEGALRIELDARAGA